MLMLKDKNQIGIAHLFVFIAILVFLSIGIIGNYVYQRVQDIKISNFGKYTLWLEAAQDESFNNYYKIGITGYQNIFQVDRRDTPIISSYSMKIKEPSAIMKVKDNAIQIEYYVKEVPWNSPVNCEIEQSIGSCDPPELRAVVDLPKNVLFSGDPKSKITININDQQYNYYLSLSDYKLTLLDQNGSSITNTVPLYPDGIARAFATTDRGITETCRNINPSIIKTLVMDNGYELAETKYPGVNKLENDVLVLAKGAKLSKFISNVDSNECQVFLGLLDLKNI
jgi:hypothetical protein